MPNLAWDMPNLAWDMPNLGMGHAQPGLICHPWRLGWMSSLLELLASLWPPGTFQQDAPSCKGPDFAIFGGFFDLGFFFIFRLFIFFLIFRPKMSPKGPGRASKGSGEALRFIWRKFQPKWPIWGPFGPLFVFQFPKKPILGPNSSKSIIPNEVLGPWDPGWGEHVASGG